MTTVPANPSADSAPSRPTRTVRDRLNAFRLRVRRIPSLLTIADQAVVSGVSFVSTVLVGRLAGAEELGLYALGGTLVLAAGHLQESLVSLPYTVFGNRVEGEARAIHAGTALTHHRVLAALAVVSLGLGGLGLSVVEAGPLTSVVCMLAVVIFFILLREFARRLAFADMEMHRALRLDATVGGVQLLALGGLAALGLLSAVTAWLAVGFACGVVGVAWTRSNRRRFVSRWDAARNAMPKHWRFGRWVTASRLTDMANSEYLLLWLLALVSGQSAAGALAMCMTVVLFSNPFVMGVAHTLTPKAARAFAGGRRPLRLVVWRATRNLGTAMAGFCVAVWLFADDVLRMLYGAEFEVYALAAFVLTLRVFVSALGLGAHEGLYAIARPDVNFKLSLLGIGVMVAAGSWLIVPLGVLGAAYSLLIATVVETVALVSVFQWLTSEELPGMRPATTPS